MAIYSLGDLKPEIHPDAYVHPDATIIGNVTIGPRSTIWPQAVLRGDYGAIIVGEDTSIQDGSVLHATASLSTSIGSRCVVGHLAHLEGCDISDDVLVGSGSVVLHRAKVDSFSLVGANAVVTNDLHIPSFSMALGVPAKVHRDKITKGQFDESVRIYIENGRNYKLNLKKIG